MKIKELMIRKNDTEKLDVSWEISGGGQSSYELFLIREGAIVERIKTSSDTTRCSLRTIVEPMKQYALLLTVKSGQLLSTVRTGFCCGGGDRLCQSISY